LVCEYLDVKDAFKLRDKFEGQLFYDKIKMKLGAKITCDNFFSIKSEIKASDLRNYNPSILINNKRYYINTFNFNDKGIQQPIIDADKIELNTIFVLFKNPNSFNIDKLIQSNTEEEIKEVPKNKNKTKFKSNVI
jgi:hypothetical protein